MNIPFKNVGKSDFDSLTTASRTGVKANRKKPRRMRIINDNIPLDEINNSNKIGFTKAEKRSTFFLPILSESVPDRKVPPAPEN